MKLERPLGHVELVERLWSAARAGRLPHALCFEGPAGTGKFVALRWFAAGLLCEGGPAEPCGTCGPCKRVLSGGETGNHPDLLVIDPVAEGQEQIRIARIAERRSGSSDEGLSVEAFLSLRSFEGGARPVLLREADRMNAAAQNALLKTLEEPQPGTLLLLETDRPDRLLPTIKSRCVRVRRGGLSDADAISVLTAEGVEPERAAALVRLAPGSPGEALAAGRQGAEEVLALAAAVLVGELEPLAAAARTWDVEADFDGATPSAKARSRARYACSRLAALLGDFLRARHGVPPRIPAHGALVAHAQDVAEARLGSAILALVECRADVGRNLAPEAVLERAFLVLADLGLLSSRRAVGAKG